MLALTVLVVLFFAGCASTPPPAQNVKASTDDLGMVADWALSMAADHGAENVLVVFDIDNTLLAMEQGLGSDQWYYWQKDLAREDPCNPAVVGDRFAVQGALFFASAMRATQDDAGEHVRRIQDAGVPVIAVTSRGTNYRLQTFRELRRNGIDFRTTALPPASGWPEDFIPDNGIRPARYEDGVFLTAGQHKGAMIQALLVKTGSPMPAVIVMADDKMENLDAVLETFTPLSPAVHAWRYTREDANVKAFDGGEAARQWEELRPALERIEEVLGGDNYSLPEEEVPEECGKL